MDNDNDVKSALIVSIFVDCHIIPIMKKIISGKRGGIIIKWKCVLKKYIECLFQSEKKYFFELYLKNIP